jgi:predicted dehydrogenase
MEVYGETGYAHALDRKTIRYRQIADHSEQIVNLEPRHAPFDDPFAWLAAVIHGTVTVADNDLSGLTNNLVVMQILDAARESARTGQTIHLIN